MHRPMTGQESGLVSEPNEAASWSSVNGTGLRIDALKMGTVIHWDRQGLKLIALASNYPWYVVAGRGEEVN